ncbi:molybdopterin-dependent oxidoreductase [Myxococcota bacterium]|nr:molybdopterin-dependent oxidoreductase [Myxococcota bacterium]
METKKTACILCSQNCGLEVELDGGRLAKIRGDEAHPISEGYLCQKAARLDHYQNHDDRLTRPLRRRADGTFEPVSWDVALTEIAQKLVTLRDRHGGKCFAFYGGGGQGNHLGGIHAQGLLAAMGSPYLYTALAQEKTGDFWVNGRLFGRQTCHTTEDVEHADFVIFLGTNPWQAHGIRNARDAVRDLGKDGRRTMVVIDPRRTETAEHADVHLQLRPGTDAFLLSAMLAIMLRDGLFDRAFIEARTTGFECVAAELGRVPIEAFVRRAGVELADVERVAHGFAKARRACLRADLGIQHTLHSTLNSYLEKLIYLLTGNFGREGSNNFHTFFIPLIGHSDEGPKNVRTVATNMPAIGKLYPPNVLPEEIESDHPERVRAVWVDSSNPMMSAADTAAYERAFAKLDLVVVVDVAMTETARHAHYVLPAASQLEKWEATAFNLDFPKNGFHLRAPLFPPRGECLPEPEIYVRLLRAMHVLPARFPLLERIARIDRQVPKLGLFPAAIAAYFKLRPDLARYGAHVLHETLGKALPDGASVAAALWPLALGYAAKHTTAVKRAGHEGEGRMLGESLFAAILGSRSGMVLSIHEHDDTWKFLRHEDRKIHVEIPEMLGELRALADERDEREEGEWPFILVAGERRAYNANTILRDPAWRKTDADGAMRIHPADADALGLGDGDRVVCRSARGAIEATIERSDTIRRGVVTLPHGYGMTHATTGTVGPALNRLTDGARRDAIAATPWHKYVPVRLERATAGNH